MIINMRYEELYPVFCLDVRPGGRQFEATQSQVDRWTAAREAFNAAQAEMEAMWNHTNGR